MSDPKELPLRRQAVVFLDLGLIHQLLDLPEGLRAAHLAPISDPPGVAVLVEGDSLDEVPHNAQAPRLGGLGAVRDHRFDPEDGKVYHRFVWEPEV